MSNMSITDILENVEKICKSYKVEHMYLFGSYATGGCDGNKRDILNGIRAFATV